MDGRGALPAFDASLPTGVGRDLRRRLASPEVLPEAWPLELRPMHGDLVPAHLLVCPDTGRLSGILDWSDACLGDPAADFGGLLFLLPADVMRLAIDAYGLEVDGRFWARTQFHGLCSSIAAAYFGVKTGDQVALHKGLLAIRRGLAESDQTGRLSRSFW